MDMNPDEVGREEGRKGEGMEKERRRMRGYGGSRRMSGQGDRRRRSKLIFFRFQLCRTRH